MRPGAAKVQPERNLEVTDIVLHIHIVAEAAVLYARRVIASVGNSLHNNKEWSARHGH